MPPVPALTLATWNVNSVRARLERLLGWLARTAPDVICLQEIKTPGDEFPFEPLRAAGYHAAVHGQRTYNGVAILAREPPKAVALGFGDGAPEEDARLIAATVRGVRVVSVYVPNGRAVGTDQWSYKLAWLARLAAWLRARHTPEQALAVAGDFNVAPEDRDVANPAAWADTVLCHEDGRAALRRLAAWGLRDAVRLHHQGPGPYSWWDYRQLAFPRGDGLRIDHLLVTAPLAARCRAAWVDRDERKGKLPSDHAPVVAAFDPAQA